MLITRQNSDQNKLVTRDKRYFMIIKRLTYLEDIIIMQIYKRLKQNPKTPETKTDKTEEEIGSSVIIVEDFNTFDNG